MPLSVLAGRSEYLRAIAGGEVVHAGTLNGNPLALAASKAALTYLRAERENVYCRMRSLGEKLSAGLVGIIREAGHAAVATGDGPVFTLHLQRETPGRYRDTLRDDTKTYSDFALALLDEGVLVLPDARWYISAAHTEADIEETLRAARRAARSVSVT
jgi:glutamate-1-semialdehyde 2,1-aminomutase